MTVSLTFAVKIDVYEILGDSLFLRRERTINTSSRDHYWTFDKNRRLFASLIINRSLFSSAAPVITFYGWEQAADNFRAISSHIISADLELNEAERNGLTNDGRFFYISDNSRYLRCDEVGAVIESIDFSSSSNVGFEFDGRYLMIQKTNTDQALRWFDKDGHLVFAAAAGASTRGDVTTDGRNIYHYRGTQTLDQYVIVGDDMKLVKTYTVSPGSTRALSITTDGRFLYPTHRANQGAPG